MTAEQIEQNAEQYAKKHYDIPFEDNSSMNVIVSEESYIAGARSRDEEIKSLENRLVLFNNDLEKALYRKEKFRQKNKRAQQHIKYLQAELNKLRNPWISVDDRLPKKDGEYVLVYLPKHNEVFQAFLCDNEWIGAPTGEEVTHWMPIPKLSKGE